MVRAASSGERQLGRAPQRAAAAPLTMEFHTFRAAFIDIPAQIVKTGRRVRWRILAYNPWLGPFFRLLEAI